jgi:hypothetical protein
MKDHLEPKSFGQSPVYETDLDDDSYFRRFPHNTKLPQPEFSFVLIQRPPRKDYLEADTILPDLRILVRQPFPLSRIPWALIFI